METSNNSGKISIRDLGARLVESLKNTSNPRDPTNQWKVMMEHLVYSLSNYDRLTPEAQKVTDDLEKQVISLVDQQLQYMPDTLETRQLRRATRGAKGERLFATGYINALESPLSSPTELFQKTRIVFEKHLQLIMDLYQDISDNTLSGPANFCKFSLLGICIDELLVAFHLSQRSYATQTFSHIRSIQEAIDLVELFNKEPQWVGLWISDKPSKEIWDELKPSQVRKKLGKDETFAKIYSLFSVTGTHPTFEMLRAKCRKGIGLSPKGNPQFSISIGGMPRTKESISTPIFLLFSLVMVLVQMINSFGRYLNEQEVLKILNEVTNDFLTFFEDCYIKPIKDSGADLQEMEGAIQEIKSELLSHLNVDKTA